jgi:hypothetical protein
MRTGLGRLGVDRVVAKLLLNHAVSDELAQIYDRGDYWKLRVEAATRWADHVLDLVEAPSTRLGRRTNSYVKPGAAALPRWSPRPMRWKVAENLDHGGPSAATWDARIAMLFSTEATGPASQRGPNQGRVHMVVSSD